MIVTASAEWHPGIVGLIAARLKERFRRPAFAFTLNPDGTATGSGRSVPGVDLGRAVRSAVEHGLAIKGGGHVMAAGVTIEAARLQAFTAYVMERLAESVGDAQALDSLAVDATLTAGGAQASIVTALERAGPFGSGQPEPVFAFPNHRLVEAREVGSGGHMRVKLRGGDGSLIGGVAFRAAGQPLGQALAQALGLEPPRRRHPVDRPVGRQRKGGDPHPGRRPARLTAHIRRPVHDARRFAVTGTALSIRLHGSQQGLARTRTVLADLFEPLYMSARSTAPRAGPCAWIPGAHAVFVYRLGHQPFTLGRRVRFP